MTECTSQDYWTTSIQGYEIIASAFITSSDLEYIISQLHLLDANHDQNSSGFTGRGSVMKIDISREPQKTVDGNTTRADLGVLIRKGRRGGAVSKFNKSHFFAGLFNGQPGAYPEGSRMWQEFFCLLGLRKAGIRVPKPVFAAVNRSRILFYSGCLGIVFLPEARNLIDILEDEINISIESILDIVYLASKEAKKSLENGVLHTDLHLGNVMLSSGEVYLIDFDKAELFDVDDDLLKKHKDFLITRWNRAIDKRVSDLKLNSILKSGFAAGLK